MKDRLPADPRIGRAERQHDRERSGQQRQHRGCGAGRAVQPIADQRCEMGGLATGGGSEIENAAAGLHSEQAWLRHLLEIVFCHKGRGKLLLA